MLMVRVGGGGGGGYCAYTVYHWAVKIGGNEKLGEGVKG